MTIKEIARLANVSIGTVDRVLHNRGRVSAKTAERILKLVDETDYRPNIHARNLSLAREYRFALLMPALEQDSGFWQFPLEGAGRAAAEMAIYKVCVDYFPFDRYSESSFRCAAAQAVETDPDGFLIAPVLPGPAADLELKIPPAIPVVYFDSPMPRGKQICSIGQNSRASGTLAARLMSFFVPYGRQVAAIQSVNGDIHIHNRIEGFLSAHEKENRPIRVDEEHLDEPMKCRSFMDNLLKGYPDLKGIFISNASSHRVAVYLEEHGIDIALIGYDLVPENISQLKRGNINFLISQRPDEQGYLGLISLCREVILKEPVNPVIQMPLDIIIKENIDYYHPSGKGKPGLDIVNKK